MSQRASDAPTESEQRLTLQRPFSGPESITDYGCSLLDAVNRPAVERKERDALPLRHPTQDRVAESVWKEGNIPRGPCCFCGRDCSYGSACSHSKRSPKRPEWHLKGEITIFQRLNSFLHHVHNLEKNRTFAAHSGAGNPQEMKQNVAKRSISDRITSLSWRLH